MRLVLDANEYLYALGLIRLPSSEALMKALIQGGEHGVRIERTIVREVCRNLPERDHRRFLGMVDVLLERECDIDEDFVVPEPWSLRYRDLGFKEGDAHIGAYAEVVEADVLVSENRRHFHAMEDHLPFRVMDAAQFLKRYA